MLRVLLCNPRVRVCIAAPGRSATGTIATLHGCTADSVPTHACIGLCRQDTWSDLQLVLVVNLTVITLFGWIKSSVVDALDAAPRAGPKPFWLSIYEARPMLCHRWVGVNDVLT